jgi:phosphoribosylaminoimidazole (AIR) synthetase
MGAGIAIYTPEAEVGKVIAIAAQNNLHAFRAGSIKAADSKQVVIKPKNIIFDADSLKIR